MFRIKAKFSAAAFCAALGNVFWGLSFLLIKVGLAYAPNPNVMLSHRFLLATLFMSLFLLTGKEKLSFKGKNWRPVVILMVMQVSYYIFETYGILYTNSVIAGLVLAVVPVATIITGALFLKEYPTWRQALFCIMPVAGVIIMTVSGQELGVIKPLGILFLLITMLISAFYKTANRKAALEFSAFQRTFMILACSGTFFTFVGLKSVGWDLSVYAAPLLHWDYSLSVFGLGLFCSITANLLVNYAAGKMSVFKLASFGSLSTLCSTVAGVVFMGEPMNLPLFLGAVLILVGIREVTRPNKSTAIGEK